MVATAGARDTTADKSSTSTCLRVTVLISGAGTNLQALLDASTHVARCLRVVHVISNQPQAYGLQRAQRAGIATSVVDHQALTPRAAFEHALAAAIDSVPTDLIVLAGFMRVLSAAFVQRYQGRMINLHPSLLPKYPGLNTYARALAAGDREHGCSVHMVTAQVDGGPLIAQAHIPILPDDDCAALQHRLAPVEHRLLVAVVTLFAQRRLRYVASDTAMPGHIEFDGANLTQPLLGYDMVTDHD